MNTPKQSQTPQDTTPNNLLRKPAVCRKLGGISGRTLNRWRIDAGFPEPILLGANTLAWRESDVDHWIMERAERTAKITRQHSPRQATKDENREAVAAG